MKELDPDIFLIWIMVSGLCLVANFIGTVAMFQWFNHLSRNKRKINTNHKNLLL